MLVPTTLSNGSICWKYKQNNLSVPGTFQSERVRARSVWYISPQNQFFGVSRYILSGCCAPYGESFLPFLLSRKVRRFLQPVLNISDAKLCIRPRKALQPPTQSFAFALAKLCICSRKALLENHLASMLILRYCNSLRIMCNIQTNKQFQNFTRLVKKSRRRYFTKMVKNSHCLLL